eukprot:scaffold117179_cov28-Tisochrysis_lutea.AAC.8
MRGGSAGSAPAACRNDHSCPHGLRPFACSLHSPRQPRTRASPLKAHPVAASGPLERRPPSPPKRSSAGRRKARAGRTRGCPIRPNGAGDRAAA